MASSAKDFQKLQKAIGVKDEIVVWTGAKVLQIWQWIKGLYVNGTRFEYDMNCLPVTSKNNSESVILGRYFVGKKTEYQCSEQGVELITLDLETYNMRKSILSEGDRVSIPPFVVHAFRVNQPRAISHSLRRVSSKTFSYTFDIDIKAEGMALPNDLHLNKNKMKFAEVFLRNYALEDRAIGLTYDNYRLLLHFVYHLALKLRLSHFEHALLLGMAFDWIQTLSRDKVGRGTIRFGTYRRIYSEFGIGYHNICATEIGPSSDIFLTYEHRSHFGEAVTEDKLPWINIERNVLIGDGASLEVGRGLSIKEFSWIAPGASLLKHYHNHEGGGQFARCVENTGLTHTEIGPYALIGQHARILPKCIYIGKGSVVGTNSVVTRSVGDYAIVAGNPARCVGYNVGLSYRIEDPKRDVKLDQHEEKIPYSQVVGQMKNRNNVFIFGARSPQTVIEAACHFKNVIVINSYSGFVPSLLEILSKEGIYNICLQNNPFSISEEMNFSRPSVIVWLDSLKNNDLENETLIALAKFSDLIIVHKKADNSSLIKKYYNESSKLIADGNYTIFKVGFLEKFPRHFSLSQGE